MWCNDKEKHVQSVSLISEGYIKIACCFSKYHHYVRKGVSHDHWFWYVNLHIWIHGFHLMPSDVNVWTCYPCNLGMRHLVCDGIELFWLSVCLPAPPIGGGGGLASHAPIDEAPPWLYGHIWFPIAQTSDTLKEKRTQFSIPYIHRFTYPQFSMPINYQSTRRKKVAWMLEEGH